MPKYQIKNARNTFLFVRNLVVHNAVLSACVTCETLGMEICGSHCGVKLQTQDSSDGLLCFRSYDTEK